MKHPSHSWLGRSPASQAWGSGVLVLLAFGCTPTASSPTPTPAYADGQRATIAVPPVGARATQLALGDAHSCALLESGRVACWGDNAMGQLGNGSDQPSTSPVFVSGLFDAIDIRSNHATTCVRRKTGAVSCWGDNAHGQANPRFDAALTSAPAPWDGTDTIGDVPPRFTPANVLRVPTSNEVATGARSISLGRRHGCAVYDSGAVKCWGESSHGQLGRGARPDAFQVQTVAGVPPLVAPVLLGPAQTR